MGIDVVFIPDVKETFHGYLLMMDMASEFTVLQWMCVDTGNRPPKTSAADAKKALFEGWCRHLLTPQRIQIDRDSAFRGIFEETCDQLGVPLIPVPTDAHHSHGKVERRVMVVKNMAEKVFADLKVDTAEGAQLAGYEIGRTCCRLSNKDGFSPAQWVLGEGIMMPASCADLGTDPCIVGQVTEGSAFWHRLRLQEACEISYHQAANS